jgi:hypothetical protein
MTVNIDRYIEDMEQWKKTREENDKLKQELQRKDNIIEKAIEYVEHNTFQNSGGDWIFTFYEGKELLLDILRGEDK